MQKQADEDELGLSSAALAALKEFALENDMLGEFRHNILPQQRYTSRRGCTKYQTRGLAWHCTP